MPSIRRRRTLGCLTAVAAMIPSILVGQEPPAPAPGSRIRVSTIYAESPSRLVIGSLVEFQGDTIVLAGNAGRVRAIPLASVRRVELSRGRRRKTLQGAAIGAGIGTAASLIFLSGFCSDPDTLCQTDEWLRAFGIIAIPPTLLGALVGSLIVSERWSPVDLARLRIGASRGRQGARLEFGVSVPFGRR